MHIQIYLRCIKMFNPEIHKKKVLTSIFEVPVSEISSIKCLFYEMLSLKCLFYEMSFQ